LGAAARTRLQSLHHASSLSRRSILRGYLAHRDAAGEMTRGYLGGVSLFDGWPVGPVVAFGEAAGEPSGPRRSGPLPTYMPVVLSRIPELVIAPLLLLVMPPLLRVVLLPLTPAREVGWLCIVCCAIAVVPDRASNPMARVIFFIASSTERSPTNGFYNPVLITTPPLRRDELKDESRHDAQAYGNR